MKKSLALALLVFLFLNAEAKKKKKEAEEEKKEPSPAQIYYSIGYQYYRMGKYNDAIRNLQRAIAESTQFRDAYVLLADCYTRIGMEDKAQETYKKLIDLDPAEGHYALGAFALKSGKYQEALNHFREALKHKKKFAKAYYGMGMVYEAMGDIETAIENYERAVKMKPKEGIFRKRLGKAYLAAGENEKAKKELEKAEKLLKKDIEVKEALAEVLFNLKDFVNAKKKYREVLQAQPQNVSALMKIGVIFEEQEKLPDSALSYYKKILKFKPDYIPAYSRIIKIYIDADNIDTAKVYLDKAFSVNPGNQILLCLAGDIHFKLAQNYYKSDKASDWEKGVEECKKATEFYEKAKTGKDSKWSDYATKAIESVKKLRKKLEDKLWWEKGKED